MKKVLKILLIVFIILLSVFMAVGCDDVVIPNDLDASEGLEFEKVWGGYEVTGIGTCKDSIVIIPNTYKDKKVVSIGKEAFKDCDQIFTIVIPGSVKTVKTEAFIACDNLRTVYIQHGVEKLKTMLFYSGSGNMDEITTQYDIYYQGTISEFQKLQSWDFNGGKSRPWFYSGYNTIIFSVYCTDGMIEYDYHKLRTEPKIHEYDENIECPYHVDNNKDRICDNCNETLPGFKHTHTVVIDKAVGATCKNTGLTEGKHCSSCGEVIVAQQTVSKKNHTESGWIIDKEATTTSAGKKHIECTVCGTVLREGSIPKIEEPTNGSTGLEFALKEDGLSYYVTGIGTCMDTDIVIPNTYNGMPVTSIGVAAFWGCSWLTSIDIPDSVTSIGDYAFRDCSSLTSIVIPDSVTSIGEYAFLYCSSLTSIVIPDGVTSIGEHAFRGCSSLTGIVISDSVTSIGDEAFRGCSSLTSVVIGNGVTSIGYMAFNACYSLTSIVIPDSVTSIGGHAFYNCSSLTSIVIPDSVTSIGNYAFRDCSRLTSIVIPDSVTSIGVGAFGGCSSLESITVEKGNAVYHSAGNCLIKTATKTLIAGCKNSIIPADGSVTSIGEDAFLYCSSLTSVKLPDSVTSIGYMAFYNCSNLTSIVIPDSVTSIGYVVFYGCSSLESITVEKGNAVYHSAGNCLIKTATKTLIAGCKNSIIPADGSVTNIGEWAFAGCSSLTSIEIPNSVTSIGGSAFENCSSLTSVKLPDIVTSIDWRAFENCSSLMSIDFKGTKAQWNAISKGDDWNLGTGNYTVHCTDGDIAE